MLFYLFMPETRPAPHERHVEEGSVETFRNYRIVLADKAFVAFLVAAVLMGMVYIQMYNSLSVYLRDNHGIEPQGYGLLLTSSAITVIGFQFWTMRVIKMRPQFLMMALGTLFYLIGFGMFGVVSAYWLFVLAVVIITIGEMIVMPTSQTLAAGFARTDMRGPLYGGVSDCRERSGGGRTAGGRHRPRQLPPESAVVSVGAAVRDLRERVLRAAPQARIAAAICRAATHAAERRLRWG